MFRLWKWKQRQNKIIHRYGLTGPTIQVTFSISRLNYGPVFSTGFLLLPVLLMHWLDGVFLIRISAKALRRLCHNFHWQRLIILKRTYFSRGKKANRSHSFNNNNKDTQKVLVCECIFTTFPIELLKWMSKQQTYGFQSQFIVYFNKRLKMNK